MKFSIRHKLSQGVCVTLISFIIFVMVIREIRLDIFLAIYNGIFMFILLMLQNKKNIEFLFDMTVKGLFVISGFVFAKLMLGTGQISNAFNGFLIRYFFYGWFLIQYIVILGFWFYINRDNRKSKHSVKEIKLFQERQYDKDRLKEYIEQFDVVGINGGWGSGKTVIVNEFIKENESDYEKIIIEPLTCNLDEIDVFLFKQLEAVLWNNRIWPHYSRKLQDIMEASSWVKQIKNFCTFRSMDRTTAFKGLCEDLQKIDKKLLLICEDIDRISESNKEHIAKLLDISAKLSSEKVKIIYEYDQEKMKELGFDHDYLEKYMPYVVNLTPVPFLRIVTEVFTEIKDIHGNLCVNDFKFLTYKIWIENFLQKELGFMHTLELNMYGIAPRRVKNFVNEVNLAMECPEFSVENNRETVIAFYWMKHFMSEMYYDLPFKDDLIDEIELEWHSPDDKTICFYTIMELVAACRIGEGKNTAVSEKNLFFSLAFNDIQNMFSSNAHEIEADYVRKNRNKLGILILLGYKFELEQTEQDFNVEVCNARNIGSNASTKLNQTILSIQHMEHNKKISRLIRNLHMNGKSEYTDAESVAKRFIKDVLMKDSAEWEEAWKNLQNDFYEDNVFKDNSTIFTLDEDVNVSLSRAIRILFTTSSYNKEQQHNIVNRFLEFYIKTQDSNNRLELEKVVILTLLEHGWKDTFFKILEYFNGLSVMGNMNSEKVYQQFLKDYSEQAYMEGYLSSYNAFRLEYPMMANNKDKVDVLMEYLKAVVANLQRMIHHEDKPKTVETELNILLKFYEKNLEIVNSEKSVKGKEVHIRSNVQHIPQYKNKAVYKELEALTNSIVSDICLTKKEFKKRLDQEYDKNNLSYREYRNLMGQYKREHEEYM